MAKFWIETSRFVRQVGQTDPAYVWASPRHPALIEVPDDTKVDAGMRPFDEPQAPIRPHYAGKAAPMGRVTESNAGKRLTDR